MLKKLQKSVIFVFVYGTYVLEGGADAKFYLIET